MKRIRTCLPVVALLAWIAPLAAQDAGSTLFAEPFDGKLSAGWSWLREDPKDWSLDKGTLIVRTSTGGLWMKDNNNRNLLLRTPPKIKEGTWAIDVLVDNEPTNAFEHGGLVWYVDDDNYVVLLKEKVGKQIIVQLVSETQGKPRVGFAEKPYEGKSVWLRMEVSAGKIRGQYRATEKDAWQTLGQSDIPKGVGEGETKIGLITGYAAKNSQHFTRFEGFRISKITDAKSSKTMDVDLGGGVSMKLVRIKPGKFKMGSPNDEAGRESVDQGSELQHDVEITRPFYMGIYTVTQAEYEKVMGTNPSWFCANGGGQMQVAGIDTARFPVESVSWEDAMEFCKKLSQKSGKNVDLPTEAEWEYACRAGSKGPFHHGKSMSSQQANFDGNFPYGGADKGPNLQRPTRVGSYEPNAYGLYDMYGNIWQSCQDFYSKDYYAQSPPRDPQGPAMGFTRAMRGGSWNGHAVYCRSAYRVGNDPKLRDRYVGFRVVLRPAAPAADPVKNAKNLDVDLGGGITMKLVRIEPGKFRMGSPNDEAEREPFGMGSELQHEVEITRPFYLGIYTVTQAEYEKVMGKNPSAFSRGAVGLDTTRFPVETVSWEDAMEFCKKLSQIHGKTFDLPTEAEWEYACRAGSTTPFHCGKSLSSKQANFNGGLPYGGADMGPNLARPARVGSYEPNAFGIHDMHGNVWQWCKDWGSDSYYAVSPVRDPQGPAEGTHRALRGGSWPDGARMCRSASRITNTGSPTYRHNDVGFRVVVRVP